MSADAGIAGDAPHEATARAAVERRHYWTTGELRTLRELYPALGVKVREHLPGRSDSSIITAASVHQVRFVGARGRRQRKWEATPAIDRDIRRAYESGVNGAAKQAAAEHGVPYWWLKRRAADLGLTRPAKKQPAWSEPELEIVRQHHDQDLEHIARVLRRQGFRRSRGAISLVRKRKLRLSPRPDDHYTGTELAHLLGLDNATVCRWCREEWIEADRRGTDRTDAQGGDMWWIHRADIRRFIVNNPHRIALAKVADPEWFIQLLAGVSSDGRQHRRKKPGGRGSRSSGTSI